MCLSEGGTWASVEHLPARNEDHRERDVDGHVPQRARRKVSDRSKGAAAPEVQLRVALTPTYLHSALLIASKQEV